MKCPECGADLKEIIKILEDRKQVTLICPNCGLVVDEYMIHSECGGRVESYIQDSTEHQVCQKCKKKWEGLCEFE